MRAFLILILALSATITSAADEFDAAKAAVTRKLKDPESARFADLKPIEGGTMNAKNRFGGYDGAKPFRYIVSRDTAIIGGGEAISTDPLDALARQIPCD